MKPRVRKKCQHGRRFDNCMDCSGSRVCKHNKRKDCCRDCHSGTFCIHDKRRSVCRECQGGSVCLHDRLKHQCKFCKGGSICVHGKRKSQCSQGCGGSALCQHGVQKHVCRECGYKCVACQITPVRKKNSECCHCHPVAKLRSKVKEAAVAALLGQWASEGSIPLYTSWNTSNKDANPAVCGRYRPDFVWDLGFRVVVLEVDEHQHQHFNYNPRCELVRMSRIVEGYGAIPVHIIRYNPDALKINGTTRKTKREERIALLKDKLSNAFAAPIVDQHIVLQHLWFDQDGDVDEFSTTKMFKTLEDYDKWVDEVAPEAAMET